MKRFNVAARRPWLEAKQEVDAVVQHVETQTMGSLTGQSRYAITNLVLPAVSAMFVATFRGEAISRVAVAAAAVERYRLKHGRLPETLTELTPEFLPTPPTDPFDGMPLRYAIRSDGYTVYSVGQDGVDHGGEETNNSGEPGVAFSVARPSSDLARQG